MEENTNNEQSLGLDEEQLQEVTGGVGFAASQIAFHQRKSTELINRANQYRAAGNYNLATNLKNQAAKHIESMNLLSSRLDRW